MKSPIEKHRHDLAHALAARRPWILEDAGTSRTPAPPPARASVALVVRPDDPVLELLLIRRAIRPGDPWSGHMAFPGGRRAPEDPSLLETARRETQEEVGIDLRARGRLLGRLDDVQPRSGAPPIVVSSFVFAVPARTPTRINAEVERAVWIPLPCLAAPGAATEYLHALASGEQLRFPAIGYQDHVIWGITYRILTQFLAIARIETEWREVQ